jgi:hypothetical protein
MPASSLFGKSIPSPEAVRSARISWPSRLLVIWCLINVNVAVAEVYTQSPRGVGFSMSDADPAVAWGNQPQYVADDFVLTSPTQVSMFRWWGLYMSGNPMVPVTGTTPPSSNFSIRVLNDASGSVGSGLASYANLGNCDRTLVTLSGTGGSFQLYEYRYSPISPLSLNANTKYWISLFDNTAGFPNDIFFAIAKSEVNDWMATRAVGGQSGWFAITAPNPGPAFELVPEPSTYAMALAGLACGGYSIFRRRKRA